MSNKTQLSNNNTKLASLIQELQGKASGGSGAIETCTVTISAGNYGGYTYYFNENLELVEIYIDVSGPATTLCVAKNSLFASHALWETTVSAGGARSTHIREVWYIIGDCILTAEDD